MFGSRFITLTTRFSSPACSSVTVALPSGNRAEVSSTTRAPTSRGTAGLIVRLLMTCERWVSSRALATASVSSLALDSASGTSR